MIEPERWYQIAANQLFVMGRSKLSEIEAQFPEWTQQQLRSALKHARQKGMIYQSREGNEWTFYAPLKAPASVWEWANHV